MRTISEVQKKKICISPHAINISWAQANSYLMTLVHLIIREDLRKSQTYLLASLWIGKCRK